MLKLFSAEQMRAADGYTIKNLGVPSQTLMQRAGVAIAEEVAEVANADSKIIVVCGTGNNGGDGYVCARELMSRGFSVSVFAAESKIDGARLSSDCQREKTQFGGTYASTIDGDIVVDCLFGTGLSRTIEGAFAEIIDEINASGAFVVSADIPSGLSSDSGLILGSAVRADKTVAIGGLKLGHALADGPDMCGAVTVKDIGICTEHSHCAYAYEDGDIAALFPARRRNSHKGTFGKATLICGSALYPGAAVLAVSSALRSGCGYVDAVCCAEVKSAIVPRFPQTVFSQEPGLTSECIAVGMGCGVSQELYNEICRLLKDYSGTLIIDADGLNSLAKFGVGVLKDKCCNVIVTPHAKEFARLTDKKVGEVLADPVGNAVQFARTYGVITLLKGAGTVITDGVKTAINTRGCSAQAKAGSGDLLSGFMCGSIARGLSAFEGAVCAAYVLGAAAELAAGEFTEWSVTAADITKNTGRAIKNITLCNI